MWNGAKLSLEIDAGQVRLYVRPAGVGETLLAAVPGSKGSPQTWTHLQGDRLILVVTPYEMGPGGRVHRIDLKTGKVTELGPIIGPPFRTNLAVSPDGRYLAFKLAVRAAEPGSGLPVAIGSNCGDGATHVDILTPAAPGPGCGTWRTASPSKAGSR